MVMTILVTTTKRMMMMAIMLRIMTMAGRQRGILTAINVILEEGGTCSLTDMIFVKTFARTEFLGSKFYTKTRGKLANGKFATKQRESTQCVKKFTQ